MGRAAIDEDAIRLLEQHNPEVEFDWTRILKQPQQSPEPAQRQSKPQQQKPRRNERPPRQQDRERHHAPEHESPAELPPVDQPVEEFEPAEIGSVTPHDALEPDPELAAAVEPHFTDEQPPEPESRPAAVSGRIGPEGLARLRARYAEVMARIAERQLDEAVREELKARAERLNPDAWVTDDEVRDGLEQYEATFESLRPMIGHPRRRRRRRG